MTNQPKAVGKKPSRVTTDESGQLINPIVVAVMRVALSLL